MKTIPELLNKLAPEEGFQTTHIAGVGVFKATSPRAREPLCYNQGIIIVGQGAKRVFVGGVMYEYNQNNYLVLSVPIPGECETLATPEEPLLALTIDFDIGMLNRIITQMDEHIDHNLLKSRENHKGIYVARTTAAIKDIVLRLLETLQSPLESCVLGPGLMYELIFRVMCGENAASLYALAMKNTNLARIDKALKHIHSSYSDSMNVGSLATLVNMSPSAFHRAFSDATASSPIQYIKKIRLSKARELLLDERLRVSETASVVGYESVAQFSREFKRYFGSSPSKYTRTQSIISL